MAPKKRTAGRESWPNNLRKHLNSKNGDVYYSWSHPINKTEKSLKAKNNFKLASERCIKLNAIVAQQQQDNTLNEILNTKQQTQQTKELKLKDIIFSYQNSFKERDFKPTTTRTYLSASNRIGEFFGWATNIYDLNVLSFNKLIKSQTDLGKNRTAQQMRSISIELYKNAKSIGQLPADYPIYPELTRNPKVKVKRSRLLLDEWQTIYNQAKKDKSKWIANSMLLALVTAQRREDIANFRFKKGRDWQGAWNALQEQREWPIKPYSYVEDDHLWIIQQKTGNLVSIPLALRLNAINISVGEAITQCRSLIISEHMLHHNIPKNNSPRGSKVHVDTISRRFADIRKKTNLAWEGKEPPTFHEQRSLAERLYKEQGINTQTLLGHKDAKTTLIYDDIRQADWMKIVL